MLITTEDGTSTSQVGRLEARLSATFYAASGRQKLRLSTEAPLELRGPFQGTTDAPRYFLRNTTSGVLAGDRYQVCVRTEPGAAAQVASSMATRVYTMTTAPARLDFEIEALPGSRLVWGPHATILQQGSQLSQTMDIRLHPGARVLVAEAIAFGRRASGESLAFTSYTGALAIVKPGRGALYRETYDLRPDARLHASLAGQGVLASIYALGVDTNAALATLRADVGKWPALSGFSALPNEAGIVARMLSQSLSDGLSFCERLVSLL